MILYYPSDREEEFPAIKKEKKIRIFSWGFYSTIVKEIAEHQGRNSNLKVINVYKIENIDSLNIKEFKNYDDELRDFIESCKKNVHQYDVVITNAIVSIHTLKALNLVEFIESYQLD